MNSQDVPPKRQQGSAIDNLKTWMTELGIDSSNIEALIMEDNENNKRLKIPYEDSKGKSKSSLMRSCPAHRHHGQKSALE
jgi:hypothetical protein